MPRKIKLTKKVLDKMTSEEHKKLKKYEKVSETLGDKMVKYQRAYVQYTRKTKDDNSLKARKMADKGFEYEYKAFNAQDEYVKYKQMLIKKYA
jgi:hypothetical protein